jgi:hypothetical protein
MIAFENKDKKQDELVEAGAATDVRDTKNRSRQVRLSEQSSFLVGGNTRGSWTLEQRANKEGASTEHSIHHRFFDPASPITNPGATDVTLGDSGFGSGEF